MAEKNLRVILAVSALDDLTEIVEYWTAREESERGEQYARDLPAQAIAQLSSLAVAAAGRLLNKTERPPIQELRVFGRSYRIIYQLFKEDAAVIILRFWHSHRDEPFR